MAEKESFEVVDRRRASTETEAPQPEAPEAEVEVPQAEEQAHPEVPPELEEALEEAAAGGMPDVDVWSLLGSFIGMLHGFAWQKMGIIANPATHEVERDLTQAKVAIDTVQFLVTQLEPRLPEGDVRELRRMTMDLQMNYLRQNSSGT